MPAASCAILPGRHCLGPYSAIFDPAKEFSMTVPPAGLAGRALRAAVPLLLSLVFLAPGHYVLMCNIVGHYGLSMHADFTVTP
jgi:hypothetical protein